MKFLKGNWKQILTFLTPVLPYGVTESWADLNPRLYQAIHIYWLKFYGMWYSEGSPKSLLFWIQLLYTLISLWLVCFLPCFGEIVYLLKRRDNIGDLAEGLYLFLSEIYTYFKIAVFWINREKIMSLLQYLHCEEFKPSEVEHRDIIMRSIIRARNIMTYYSTLCVFAVSVAAIIPITENFVILPTNVEYPFIDVYKSPFYEILYLHHFIIRYFGTEHKEKDQNRSTDSRTGGTVVVYYKPATCIIDGAMDTLLASFVASAIGQMEILMFNIRNFKMVARRREERERVQAKEVPADYYARNVLRNCIVHHNSIIKYVSMIESAFSLASALQFMLSVMVLCLVGIQFLSIEAPMSHPMQIAWMAVYLTCMLIEVFILCWFGDELIWKSRELRQAAFNSPWLDISPKTAMYIIIFLERCNRPLCVTAGKIFTLSLDTYTVLINWAYKAFAVMRNTKKLNS